MYVYQKTERNLWTVGYYTPLPATWVSESDHDSPEKAAARVRFLNGGNTGSQIVAQLLEALEGLLEICRGIPHGESLTYGEELAVDHAIEQAIAAIAAVKEEQCQ